MKVENKKMHGKMGEYIVEETQTTPTWGCVGLVYWTTNKPHLDT